MDPKAGGVSRPDGTDVPSVARPVVVALQGLRTPVVVILLLAAFFDGISGNPIHGVVLGLVALALALDADRGAVIAAPSSPRVLVAEGRRTALLAAGVAIVYAIAVGTFGRYSWPATAAIVLPGVGVLMLAWRGPLPGAAEPVRPAGRGVLLWSAAFVALSLWELAALLQQPSLTTDSYAHPTISVLSDPALATHPGRSAILFVWLSAGWFLVRR